jgi:hypothetical protein
MDNIKLMSLSPNISIDQQMLEMFLSVRTTAFEGSSPCFTGVEHAVEPTTKPDDFIPKDHVISFHCCYITKPMNPFRRATRLVSGCAKVSPSNGSRKQQLYLQTNVVLRKGVLR